MRFLLVKFLTSIYHYLLSPALHLFFGPQFGCRFVPTCSQYAAQAIQHHGVLKGSFFSLKRISRCHPFAQAGNDPVPRDIGRAYFNSNPHQGR